MATLVLTALGTAVGGPLGGAAGAILGRQVDGSLAGAGTREGARVRDLAVTTSAYGQPLPRHFGRVRTAGTIIWATDLIEQSETAGGGKGRPSTTGYSYAASLAVALASRPIAALGRVWADGQLLRGAAGDLKVGGALRVHHGHGDQQPDPLIAADLGAACPAFRGLAYCVFEGLQLASFGNRIPALTFELIADDGDVALADVVQPVEASTGRLLPGLAGWSDAGGGLAGQLAEIGTFYPLSCRAGERLEIVADGQAVELELPEAAVRPATRGWSLPDRRGGLHQRQCRLASVTSIWTAITRSARSLVQGRRRAGMRCWTSPACCAPAMPACWQAVLRNVPVPEARVPRGVRPN